MEKSSLDYHSKALLGLSVISLWKLVDVQTNISFQPQWCIYRLVRWSEEKRYIQQSVWVADTQSPQSVTCEVIPSFAGTRTALK